MTRKEKVIVIILALVLTCLVLAALTSCVDPTPAVNHLGTPFPTLEAESWP